MISLDSAYTVTDEQRLAYRTAGFAVLRGVASSSDIDLYRPLIQRAVRTITQQHNAQGRIEEYGGFFQQATNIWQLPEGVRPFILARRFARIAADLMGVDAVRLYQDQALFKPAGAKPTPWHQDKFYWPLDTEHTITMWMPLVDIRREMGTLRFATCSHTEGILSRRSISDESDREFESLIQQHGYAIASHDLNAGDATFHSGLTIHSTHPNSSNTPREVITIIYFVDGTCLAEPANEFQKADMEVFHPGLRPGDLAASPLNPILFTRS